MIHIIPSGSFTPIYSGPWNRVVSILGVHASILPKGNDLEIRCLGDIFVYQGKDGSLCLVDGPWCSDMKLVVSYCPRLVSA